MYITHDKKKKIYIYTSTVNFEIKQTILPLLTFGFLDLGMGGGDSSPCPTMPGSVMGGVPCCCMTLFPEESSS